MLPESIRASLAHHAQSGAIELPVLPDTAVQVLSICNRTTSDARELALLIERDQSLAGHVLRLANSAAYAPTHTIVSLQQAVARLGNETLSEIAVGVALQGKVFRVKGFDALIRSMWRHSAAAGAYAREIARATRKNVEGAFLCGLFHDVGKPISLHALAEICEEADVELDHGLAVAAMDHFHGLLGGMLARRWKLAPWIETAAEHHHDYRRAKVHREEAMVTHFADHLAHWALGTREVDPFALEVVSDLELYGDDVERLLGAKNDVLELVEAFA